MKGWLIPCLLMATPCAHAAYDYTGTIEMVYSGPPYGGKVFIQISSAPTGTVVCDTNGTFDFAFDATTPEGKIVFSAILTAYASGKTVRLTSTDLCSLYSGIPDLSTFSLK